MSVWSLPFNVRMCLRSAVIFMVPTSVFVRKDYTGLTTNAKVSIYLNPHAQTLWKVSEEKSCRLFWRERVACRGPQRAKIICVEFLSHKRTSQASLNGVKRNAKQKNKTKWFQSWYPGKDK